ncbi:DUF6867 family protein [Alsobacter sp. KACC 23698]|uniref:DUF6867 family protein n=1 Tax=Alsobacter sp. KACC 23698 TaxID=3149229 RepID=A0AAU7JAN3_9HYPH
MQGVLYEESSIGLFLLVSIVMGGAAAWASGKSIAQTWRPAWMVVPYMLILGMAVRFIHFALFEGTLLSGHYYVVDTLILLAAGALGFRYKRTQQMTTQYRWLYEKTGPFSWRERSPAAV